MHIEYLVTKRPTCNLSDEGYQTRGHRKRLATNKKKPTEETPTTPPLEQYLIDLDGEVRDERAAEILCFAATWVYSDLTTFAAAMCPRGLYGEFVGINIANDVAFVDTTAYLFVSETKKLAILAFRGTELTNPINWLTDMSAGMRMIGEGGIHGGFLTAALAIMPLLQELLLCWSKHSCSIAEALYQFRKDGCYPPEAFPTLEQLAPHSQNAKDDLETLKKLETLKEIRMVKKVELDQLDQLDQLHQLEAQLDQLEAQLTKDLGRPTAIPSCKKSKKEENEVPPPALYICGHSLGGAFASLAGVELYLRPRLRNVQDRLRSIYTFGAPAWGDATIVDTFEEKGLGKRVFRHRYENDIVPLLPGRHQGAYKHLGCSYKNLDGVWVRSGDIEEQVHLGLFAILYGFTPFLTEAMPGWRPFGIKWLNIPGLMGLLLPYSWMDHKPDRYLRVSQAPKVGFEIHGGDLATRASGLSCWRQQDKSKESPSDVPCEDLAELDHDK